MKRFKVIKAFLAMITLLTISSCGDECSSYSEFSCKEIENAEYNVEFSFPDNEKIYHLGQVKGLRECGNLAYDYAAQHNMTRNNNWGYVCCMIAKGSSCYEKHR